MLGADVFPHINVVARTLQVRPLAIQEGQTCGIDDDVRFNVIVIDDDRVLGTHMSPQVCRHTGNAPGVPEPWRNGSKGIREAIVRFAEHQNPSHIQEQQQNRYRLSQRYFAGEPAGTDLLQPIPRNYGKHGAQDESVSR